MLEWLMIFTHTRTHTHTHTHLTLKLANLTWKTCVDLFIQTDLTFNVMSVIYQQPLSLCLSANITHDLRFSTCVLASSSILTVDFTHIDYVRHIFLTSGSFFFDLAPPGVLVCLRFLGWSRTGCSSSGCYIYLRCCASCLCMCGIFRMYALVGPFKTAFLSPWFLQWVPHKCILFRVFVWLRQSVMQVVGIC